MVEPHNSNFRVITTNVLGVRIFRKFTVIVYSAFIFFQFNFLNSKVYTNWYGSIYHVTFSVWYGVLLPISDKLGHQDMRKEQSSWNCWLIPALSAPYLQSRNTDNIVLYRWKLSHEFFSGWLYFYYHLGFTARQGYFTHFEPSQSKGGAKTGAPREKPPDHPQAELGLSHMWPELGLNPQKWDERLRALKISVLYQSTTGAAKLSYEFYSGLKFHLL